jgi:hypothetical protein
MFSLPIELPRSEELRVVGCSSKVEYNHRRFLMGLLSELLQDEDSKRASGHVAKGLSFYHPCARIPVRYKIPDVNKSQGLIITC